MIRRLSRPVLLSFGIQAICVGIGFWFQYQLVISTTERDATELEWSDLTAQSAQVIGLAQSLAENKFDWETFSTAVPQVSHVEDPSQPALLLTDSHGAILGFTKAAASGQWHSGQLVTWKPDRHGFSLDGSQFGRLVTALGERTAVLHQLKNRDRQIIVYAATPMIPSWKKSLQGSLAVASGLGCLWTLSLSVIVNVLLSSRTKVNSNHQIAERNNELLKNAQDLVRTRDAVIFGLAKLAESRDPETGHHLERIAQYATRLATALRHYPKYQRTVTPTFVRLLGISSVLHDIGKVGLEDTVLLKPGKLSGAERLRMQQHTLVAGDCLKEIEQRLGASNFLQTAREIALHHHERWNGSGYPYGLAGEAIPLSARIVAICDVYDALNSKRVYKDAFPHEDCVTAIRTGSGSQFDPELVEVFLEVESEFAAISRRFANEAAEPSSRSTQHAANCHGQTMSESDSAVLESVIGNQQQHDDSQSRFSVA